MFSKSACVWFFYIMFLSLMAFIPIFIGIGIIPVFISMFPLPRFKRVFVSMFIDTIISLPLLLSFISGASIAGLGVIDSFSTTLGNGVDISLFEQMFSFFYSVPIFICILFLSVYSEVWCCERIGYIKRVKQRIDGLR